jgi:hypothetical protein
VIAATGGHTMKTWRKAQPATELYRENTDYGALKQLDGLLTEAYRV